MKSKVEREQAMALKCEGYGFKEISNILGITYDAARNLCQYKAVKYHKKRGTKPRITMKTSMSIRRATAGFKSLEARVTSSKIKARCNLNVSPKTIQRHMTKIGAKYRRSKNQIVLSRSNKEQRVTLISKWNITIFSDEKRFSMEGSDINDNAKVVGLWYGRWLSQMVCWRTD